MGHLQKLHAPAVLRFATRLTRGDVHRAEDIVQETMVRAWRHAGSARDAEGRWNRTWLLTVARRVHIDQVRAALIRPEEPAGEVVDERATVGDDVDRLVDADAVHAALGTLPERQRVTLVEIYLRGRTVAEVSELLSVPPGTVKSRAHYGLKAMRTVLYRRGFS